MIGVEFVLELEGKVVGGVIYVGMEDIFNYGGCVREKIIEFDVELLGIYWRKDFCFIRDINYYVV